MAATRRRPRLAAKVLDGVRFIDDRGTLIAEYPWPAPGTRYVGSGKPRGRRPKSPTPSPMFEAVGALSRLLGQAEPTQMSPDRAADPGFITVVTVARLCHTVRMTDPTRPDSRSTAPAVLGRRQYDERFTGVSATVTDFPDPAFPRIRTDKTDWHLATFLSASVGAFALLIMVTGCTASPSPSPSPRAVESTPATTTAATPTVVVGLTAEHLCDIAQRALAPSALSGTHPEEEQLENGNMHSCRLDTANGSEQWAQLTVNYDNVSIADIASENASLARNAEQCPGGASLLEVTAGLTDETSIVCDTTYKSLFEYSGKTAAGTFVVRVERLTTHGTITEETAQQWVDAVAGSVLT